jgi:hypothetical protein
MCLAIILLFLSFSNELGWRADLANFLTKRPAVEELESMNVVKGTILQDV